MAWAGRYGHATVTELLEMTLEDFAEYSEALNGVIERENESSKPES